MTKTTTLAALSAACAALAACGGGGSSDSPAPPPPAPPPPAAQTYDYVPPAAGETDVWTRILTDSLGTIVSMQIRQQVTSTSDSGAIQLSFDDPTATNVVEDGVTFRTTPEVVDVAANGNTLDYTTTATDGTQTTCVYGNPQNVAAAGARRAQALALRRGESLTVGQTWNTSYTIACGSQPPITFTSVGVVQAPESVVVGAGTFMALKETVSTTYTSGGVQFTSDETVWRDPARSLFTVMLDASFSRSDQSEPYITHELRQLLSRQ